MTWCKETRTFSSGESSSTILYDRTYITWRNIWADAAERIKASTDALRERCIMVAKVEEVCDNRVVMFANLKLNFL